jgi:glyceraldehyde 3-phosphate dehydrogenase
MTVKIGLNGFGRIGRYMARILAGNSDYELTAVNARADNPSLAHLLKYDSVHGPFSGTVQANEDGFLLKGQQVTVTRKHRDSCQQHLDCGCQKVLISAPGKNCDATIVMGVNDHLLKPEDRIVSNASCTTNCLAPAAKVLADAFGIDHGCMNTVHSYTMSQRILDGSHKDLRRARAACMSMIPTTTGAAKAVEEVIPELQGRLSGMAVRVPTPNVSLVDLTVQLLQDSSAQEVNAALKAAAQGSMKDILGYSEEPLVSIDYTGSHFGGVVDALTTTMTGKRLLKCIVWYDNESGFSWQLFRLLQKAATL